MLELANKYTKIFIITVFWMFEKLNKNMKKIKNPNLTTRDETYNVWDEKYTTWNYINYTLHKEKIREV